MSALTQASRRARSASLLRRGHGVVRLVLGATLLSAAAGALLAPSASAQSAGDLATRVAGVRNGAVRLEFPARAGVCGNGSSWIQTGENSWTGSRGATRDVEPEPCESGPVRVVVERRDGRSTALRTYVGGRWRTDAAATDLGAVPAAVATDWLLSVARSESEPMARAAFLPLTISEAPVPWMEVLAVARDATRPRAVRGQAIFWAGQAAGDREAAALGGIVESDPDAEIRKQAVFALSRRADGVERLLGIARTSDDRAVKRAAYFWLGQSKDPRAIALFEEVLSRR